MQPLLHITGRLYGEAPIKHAVEQHENAFANEVFTRIIYYINSADLTDTQHKELQSLNVGDGFVTEQTSFISVAPQLDVYFPFNVFTLVNVEEKQDPSTSDIVTIYFIIPTFINISKIEDTSRNN